MTMTQNVMGTSKEGGAEQDHGYNSIFQKRLIKIKTISRLFANLQYHTVYCVDTLPLKISECECRKASLFRAAGT